MNLPIIDLHCDMLSYLATLQDADPFDPTQIACAIPLLVKGNVKLQVMAIYTDVRAESMHIAMRQAEIFQNLLNQNPDQLTFADSNFLAGWGKQTPIGIIAAVENAAGLGHEYANWKEIESQLTKILSKVGRLAYISLTHHTENRFGGGNYTDGIGLKDDGKRLLDYLDAKKIPVDLSHTSDVLAEGILNHIDQSKLTIPVIASHSNFRGIWTHLRNLTDEFAKEIVHREGVIGVNFLRAFLDNNVPERLYDHLLHAFTIGADKSICFGADFFYTQDFPDQSRIPFYFPLAENAGKYPSILAHLETELSKDQLKNLAFGNALNFYRKLWD